MPDYTLTDVMVGLHKHDLINILTDEEWTFLTGLILYANERGFKNPIDLAVKQATHAGGGNSRQSVNRRRNSLAKVKINGKPLLTVIAGKPGQKLVATYEIDYNLICSYNGVWYTDNESPSQKSDGKRTQGGRRADGGRDLPKIRSDQRRGEKIPPTPLNEVTTGNEAPDSENGGDGIFATEEKSEKEFERIKDELSHRQVRDPNLSKIARDYNTRYLERQILQMDRDHLDKRQNKFENPGAVLVARIKSNHPTPDYPE